MGRKFPFKSFVLIPKTCKEVLAAFVGAAKFVNMPRRPVPALEPFKPFLANIPLIPRVVLKSVFASKAEGAAYCIVYARSVSPAGELTIALLYRFATLRAILAFKPKWLKVCAVISAAAFGSVSVANPM